MGKHHLNDKCFHSIEGNFQSLEVDNLQYNRKGRIVFIQSNSTFQHNQRFLGWFSFRHKVRFFFKSGFPLELNYVNS